MDSKWNPQIQYNTLLPNLLILNSNSPPFSDLSLLAGFLCSLKHHLLSCEVIQLPREGGAALACVSGPVCDEPSQWEPPVYTCGQITRPTPACPWSVMGSRVTWPRLWLIVASVSGDEHRQWPADTWGQAHTGDHWPLVSTQSWGTESVTEITSSVKFCSG